MVAHHQGRQYQGGMIQLALNGIKPSKKPNLQ